MQASYTVKLNCPHVNQHKINNMIDFIQKYQGPFKCQTCSDDQECWVCVACQSVQCSRSVKGHMLIHNSQTHHPIAFGSTQFTFWCYSCDQFIDASSLMLARKKISHLRFKNKQIKGSVENLKEQFQDFGLNIKTLEYFNEQDINLELLMILDKEEIKKFNISVGDQLRIINHLKK